MCEMTLSMSCKFAMAPAEGWTSWTGKRNSTLPAYWLAQGWGTIEWTGHPVGLVSSPGVLCTRL